MLTAQRRANTHLTLKISNPSFSARFRGRPLVTSQWDYMLIDQGTNYWLHVVASEFGPSLDKSAREHWKYMDDHGQRDI